MNVFFSSDHARHRPPNEIFNGNRDEHQEVPERVEQILSALAETDHVVRDVRPNTQERRGLERVLREIHTRDYLAFVLETDFGDEYVYPSVFPYRDLCQASDRAEAARSTHPVALRGFYSFDLYTPLSATTAEAALGAAYLAQRVAEEVLETGHAAYALCRPPGHHAEPARMGGYCYLNNGAVAAQTFRNADSRSDSQQNRVAILDVDFHHGNGAEKIFGETEEILTISIHADPNEKFPFFSGQETDEYVSNRNFPLPLGTTNEQYQRAVDGALAEIARHGTTHVVVCFGADTHESDPIGGFKLTTEYYTKLARQIHSLDIPTVIIQEGGYNTKALGENVVAFLAGFEK